MDGSASSATLNSTSVDAAEMEIMAGTDLENFIFFNDLPVELRVKIWNYLLPGPRVVPIYFDVRGHNLITTVKPPTLLRVCQEARLEAQREYPPVFAMDGVSTVVPFNFKLDTLYVTLGQYNGYLSGKSSDIACDYFKRLPLEDRHRVRSVALDHGSSEALEKVAPKHFPGISTLILVSKDFGKWSRVGACPCYYRLGDFRHWSSNFEFDLDLANRRNRIILDTASRIFKVGWMRSNGGSSVYTLPQVKVGTLMHKCSKSMADDGDFITIPSEVEKYSNRNQRRSARLVVKKDYKEIPEDEKEFA